MIYNQHWLPKYHKLIFILSLFILLLLFLFNLRVQSPFGPFVHPLCHENVRYLSSPYPNIIVHSHCYRTLVCFHSQCVFSVILNKKALDNLYFFSEPSLTDNLIDIFLDAWFKGFIFFAIGFQQEIWNFRLMIRYFETIELPGAFFNKFEFNWHVGVI